MKTLAKLENTVCLLCLPPPEAADSAAQGADAENCTVVGYGRLTDGPTNSLQISEGIKLNCNSILFPKFTTLSQDRVSGYTLGILGSILGTA